MTDTDRIAALEREVAELKAYTRQLQWAGSLPAWATARKTPGTAAPTSGIGNSFVTCPMCGTHEPYWHNCSRPVNSYTVGGHMLCQSCGQLTVVGSWHTCASTLITTGGTS